MLHYSQTKFGLLSSTKFSRIVDVARLSIVEQETTEPLQFFTNFRSIPLERTVTDNTTIITTPQKLTISIVDDCPVEMGADCCDIRSHHQKDRVPAASDVIDARTVCPEYSRDLTLLNFCRDAARELDFLAALKRQADDYLLAPIEIVTNVAVGEEAIENTLISR
jgi:hypothetical protein